MVCAQSADKNSSREDVPGNCSALQHGRVLPLIFSVLPLIFSMSRPTEDGYAFAVTYPS